MSGEVLQIAMLIAQVCTAGGTGGVLFMLGKVLERQISHGERLDRLETIERGWPRRKQISGLD